MQWQALVLGAKDYKPGKDLPPIPDPKMELSVGNQDEAQ
ncbi:hypothetical protein ACPOL_6540 [Acidisarcina polymorpha]|uniref:Uncharacterized protein n=1 Tax=Acidisarcina polymorpha TaxID=2211140 RepID=A0A2Z5GA19_9BACT|nr:hypothetical protein ACPOL_6540 [Acidisarcina polymorpha]